MSKKEKVLVILPTHNKPHLIDLSIESILNQTYGDFLLAVCGDGVNDETRDVLQTLGKLDDRIVFFDFQKRGRTGEFNRNLVIEKYKPNFITYLADDDLLLKNHIDVMMSQIINRDFVHPMPMFVRNDNSLFFYKESVTKRDSIQRLNDRPGYSFLTISGPIHTYDVYKKVNGWEDTPIGWPTDKYMWLKMLNLKGIKAKGLSYSTTIKLQSPTDKKISILITKDEERDQMLYWSEKIKHDNFFNEWNEMVKKQHASPLPIPIGY